MAFGLKLNRYKGNMDERVEKAPRRPASWEEVKDKLKKSGLSLSGGQQQRAGSGRRTLAATGTRQWTEKPLDP